MSEIKGTPCTRCAHFRGRVHDFRRFSPGAYSVLFRFYHYYIYPHYHVCVRTWTLTTMCVSIHVPHYHVCVHTCTPLPCVCQGLHIDNSERSMICAFYHISETIRGKSICHISNRRAFFSLSHDANEIIIRYDLREK